MQLDRAPEHQRRQHVTLQLLHDDRDAHDDERRHRALADQGDQGGDQPGQERPDDRQEGAEEHQEGQGNRQRHPDDRQADADEHAVDQPHGRLAAQVGAERLEGAPADGTHLPRPRPGLVGEPVPHPVAVLDEEEGEHQRQQRPGDHLDRQRRAAEHAPRQRSGVGLGLLARPVEQAGELRVGDVERPLAEPVLDVVEAGGDPVP